MFNFKINFTAKSFRKYSTIMKNSNLAVCVPPAGDWIDFYIEDSSVYGDIQLAYNISIGKCQNIQIKFLNCLTPLALNYNNSFTNKSLPGI